MSDNKRFFDNIGFFKDDYQVIFDKIVENHAFLLNKAIEVQSILVQISRKIQLSQEYNYDTTLTSLYIHILGRYEAVIILAQRGITKESKVLLRSMLESYLILRVLCNEEKLFSDFIVRQKMRDLKLLNRRQNNRKYYDESNIAFIDYEKEEKQKVELANELKDILFKEEKLEMIRFLLKYSKKLEKLNIKLDRQAINKEKSSLKGEELFDFENFEAIAGRCKMKLAYDMAYTTFCQEVHVSLGSLRDWLAFEDKNVIGIRTRNTKDAGHVIGTCLNLLIESTLVFTKKFGYGYEDELNRLRKEIEDYYPRIKDS